MTQGLLRFVLTSLAGVCMRVPLIVAALVSLGSAALQTSNAKDWYVKPDGTGDLPSIWEATGPAIDGDRIILADGIFVGERNHNVLVFEEFEIISESNDPSRCIID